jgi:hypothetical protein
MSRARDIANFDPALLTADEVSLDKVNGGTLGTGTIGGSSVINTSGAITTTGINTSASLVLTPGSAPATTEGAMYYDSTDDIVKISDGTVFKGLSAEGVAGLTAQGGTITDYNTGGQDYRVHTFYSSGILIFYATTACDVFMCGGGGSGGARVGGGGGGGAYLFTTGTSQGLSVKAGTYNIVVGAGGTTTFPGYPATQGQSTMAFGVIATGGAGGIGRMAALPTALATPHLPANGGGGGLSQSGDNALNGSTGNDYVGGTPSGWTYAGGNDGGDHVGNTFWSDCSSGGGAGSGGDGGDGVSGGDGGDGANGSEACTWVTPESVGRGANSHRNSDETYYFCAGGGGFSGTHVAGKGGHGGGGGSATVSGTAGAKGDYSIAQSLSQYTTQDLADAEAGVNMSKGGRAACNSGSGGGGGSHSGSGSPGGAGGSGIVIIRYEI